MTDQPERILRSLAETLGQHQWLIRMLVNTLEENGTFEKGDFQKMFVREHRKMESFGRDYAQTLFDSEGHPKTTWD